MDQVTCLLPGGYVDEAGVVQRRVVLAPLNGREEAFLADHNGWDSASLVTLILSRCIQGLGPITPVSEEVTRNLLVADRQYLLLKLRQATFGDQVQIIVFCPWPDCGARMDIDFSIQDIPIRESEDKGPLYRMQLSQAAAFATDEGVYREIAFRLPNGGDQEVISPLLAEDEARASALLLERCVQRIGPWENPGSDRINQLSPMARMEIEQQMEGVGPQVELTMSGECPECGHEIAIPFDLQGLFFGELRTSRDLLYREVHYLAYHYHWSEREIMAMTREQRRKYIEVLAEEIGRLNNAIG